MKDKLDKTVQELKEKNKALQKQLEKEQVSNNDIERVISPVTKKSSLPFYITIK